MMPRIDVEAIPQTNATGYPPPHDAPVAGRWYRRLAPAAGLTALGASHVVLKPGAWSSQRHWHEGEDELLVMLTGEAILVEDEGETLVRPGDIAAFAAGVRNGHHLVNRSDSECSFLVVSAGPSLGGAYSDIDMRFEPDGRYVRRDGAPLDARRV
jgi:uncharacterized cupin superfamily protein